MKKVSIIVPIYNAGSKLKKCVKSLINQTYSNLEIILVNDGSLDQSLSVCEKFVAKDFRIKLINKENEGSIATRQRGIDLATGEYIMFVDADDWVHPTITERLIKSITDEQDIVVCNSYRVLSERALLKQKNESHYFKQYHSIQGDDIRIKIVEAFFHGHPFPATLYAKLFKRELIQNSGRYVKRLKFLGDDLYLNLEVLLKAKSMVIIDEPLYYYRVGGNTSRYMPYHFYDITEGYKIQKEVIEAYYPDYRDKHLGGISIMLLNSFKTSLQNICASPLSGQEIQEVIDQYCNHPCIVEALKHSDVKKFFSQEYLTLIQEHNVDELYQLGLSQYQLFKKRQRKLALLSKVL